MKANPDHTATKVLYVLSSHWDRKWYQTFQRFRARLVDMLDEILEGFREGELKGPFATDG